MTNRPLKTLVILDLDNTLVDTLKIWGESLTLLIDRFAAIHDIGHRVIYDMIREARGQHRFNDGVSLIDYMRETNPALSDRRAEDSLCKLWEKQAAPVLDIRRQWLEDSAVRTVPYSGVMDTLQHWNNNNVQVVIQTDAEECAVVRRLWLLGQAACSSGMLSSPHEILDLVDRVYCQPHIPFSPDFLSDVSLEFQGALKNKTHIWGDRLYKPAPTHLRQILADCNVAASQAVYIGDTHKDGAEAKSVSPAVDFAWARYGTAVDREIMDLYAKVGSRSYSYGEDIIRREMLERGVMPDVILQAGLAELLTFYDWTSPDQPEVGSAVASPRPPCPPSC